MKFIKNPNLPEHQVKLAAVGNHQRVIELLHKLGTEVFVLSDNQNIQIPVRMHADMSLLHLGDKKFLSYDEGIAEYLRKFGADIDIPRCAQGCLYPQDVGLNALFVGDNLVCNTRYCVREVLDQAKLTNKRIIDVNQGYARCSVAVIDKNSVITADEAIARKLSGEGFDVLRIRPGCIELPGYDYGFIGGCCGKLSSDKILFCGNPLNHPDGRLITEFIKSKDIEIITTDESNLFDFGGIVQIF